MNSGGRIVAWGQLYCKNTEEPRSCKNTKEWKELWNCNARSMRIDDLAAVGRKMSFTKNSFVFSCFRGEKSGMVDGRLSTFLFGAQQHWMTVRVSATRIFSGPHSAWKGCPTPFVGRVPSAEETPGGTSVSTSRRRLERAGADDTQGPEHQYDQEDGAERDAGGAIRGSRHPAAETAECENDENDEKNKHRRSVVPVAYCGNG